MSSGWLRYTGSSFLRQRLALSVVSGKPIVIADIRAKDEEPGLRDYEASFLRLLDKICDGSDISIDETGTTLRYKPGQIVGGSGLVHSCPSSRCLTYFLEVRALDFAGIAALGRQKNEWLADVGQVTNNSVDVAMSRSLAPEQAAFNVAIVREHDGSSVAIKVTKVPWAGHLNQEKAIAGSEHPNLVKLLAELYDNDGVIMELCEGSTEGYPCAAEEGTCADWAAETIGQKELPNEHAVNPKAPNLPQNPILRKFLKLTCMEAPPLEIYGSFSNANNLINKLGAAENREQGLQMPECQNLSVKLDQVQSNKLEGDMLDDQEMDIYSDPDPHYNGRL
ncbi:RCL1 [Symbiodinium sp. KB8]|nr:RCL1 [Symbiodinium sp. KB8]